MFIPESYLFVVGGENHEHAIDTVELISVKGPLPERLRGRKNFPVKITGAAGITLGECTWKIIHII